MTMSEERKKFDSNDQYRILGARLAKDARVFEGDHGKMVTLTFASESRRDKHETLWVNANISDYHSNLASFLKKGDVLLEVRGKPVLRPYDGGKAFELERAEVSILPEMFATLKERGFTPGAGKPAAKPGKAPSKRRPIVDIDDED